MVGHKVFIAARLEQHTKKIQHAGHLKLVPIKLLRTLPGYLCDALISVLAKRHHVAAVRHDYASVSDVLDATTLEATKKR